MEQAANVKGVAPGFLLLPAREYDWQLDRRVEIRIPRRGSVSSISENNPLPEGVQFPGDDTFSLFEDNLLQLWEVVRVMFVGSQYPQLEDNQCLNVVAVEFLEEEVILYGEVIRSL